MNRIKKLLIFLFFIYYIFLCFHSQEELESGEDVATCPSCSLIIKVIYDLVSKQLCQYCHVHYYAAISSGSIATNCKRIISTLNSAVFVHFLY